MKKQHTRTITGSLLIAVLLMLVSTPAMTTGKDTKADSDTSQSSQQQISDAELSQFADAFVKIRSLRAEYASKYKDAKTKSERIELQKQNTEEMKEAIRSTGMKVERYKQIVQQVNQDKQLQNRLWQVMHPEGESNSGASG